MCVWGGPVRIYFKYMSRELNKREGIKYFLTFLGAGVWGFLSMNLHTINYTLDRAPWPSSVFSTSSVDASKILAFVNPFFFFG